MLMRTTTSRGQVAWRVFQKDAGGPPIVFLHGAGGRKEIWSAVGRRLGRSVPDRPVVIMDLPGHGESPPPGLASIDHYADVIGELVVNQGWTRFAVGGHSMGGAVAQVVAARFPDRVTELILVATGARIPIAPVLFDLLPGQADAVTVLFKEWGFGPKAPPFLVDAAMQPFAQTDPGVIAGDLAACRDWRADGCLAAIRAKTLVVAGELDRMIKTKITTELAAAIPGATFSVLPETGHMIPVERDRDLAALIAAFVEG